MKRDLKHLKDTVASVEDLAAARQQQLEERLAVANEELARHRAATAALHSADADVNS